MFTPHNLESLISLVYMSLDWKLENPERLGEHANSIQKDSRPGNWTQDLLSESAMAARSCLCRLISSSSRAETLRGLNTSGCVTSCCEAMFLTKHRPSPTSSKLCRMSPLATTGENKDAFHWKLIPYGANNTHTQTQYSDQTAVQLTDLYCTGKKALEKAAGLECFWTCLPFI